MEKNKIFYGWWIVTGLILISAYNQGIIAYSFTAIIEPISDEFGWSYAMISLAASIRGFETGFLAPIIGILLDRLGPRKILFTGVVIIGLGLVLLSRLSSLWMFFAVFALISVGMSCCQGVVPMAVVGNWFQKKVSFATGIVVSGPAIGALLVPLVTLLIDRFGWRTAMVVFGLGSWLVILPVTFLIRYKPEPYGLFPDGDTGYPASIDSGSNPERPLKKTISIRDILSTRFFWHISIGFMCHVLAITAVLTHVMPYMSTLGISRSFSSLAACVLPFSSVLGRLSAGWFGDRFSKKLVTIICFILTCISMLLFRDLTPGRAWLLAPFLILFGLGYGGPVPMSSALLREYFGRANLGTVLGFSQGITVIGIILGAPIAGWIFDHYGNYQGAWFAMAGILMAGLIIISTSPPSVSPGAIRINQGPMAQGTGRK